MPNELLFSPLKFGRVELKNRVVMSPMTRSRSIGNIPGDLVAKYYGQRAEAGLIITEGTSPSPNGLGYPRIPGLFNAEQVAGWKKTTSAVHAAGGHIFVQLMHTGRVTHPDNLPPGGKVLAPSALPGPDKMWVDSKMALEPTPVPAPMTPQEIETAIEEYAKSGELAIEAGFDGVELHGANGYLIEQFLNTASNVRTDEWGGAIDNRIRFAVEVAKRVAKRIGSDRLGIRLSPFGVFGGMASEATTEDTFERLVKALWDLKLLYVHTVDHAAMGAPEVPPSIKQKIRAAFKGIIILSGGYDKARAEKDLQEKKGELVAFGRPFIANPKLVTKLRENKELRPPQDMSTFYSPGEKGYTDYPME
jgi:N-ethylmaleimide reductase